MNNLASSALPNSGGCPPNPKQTAQRIVDFPVPVKMYRKTQKEVNRRSEIAFRYQKMLAKIGITMTVQNLPFGPMTTLSLITIHNK